MILPPVGCWPCDGCWSPNVAALCFHVQNVPLGISLWMFFFSYFFSTDSPSNSHWRLKKMTSPTNLHDFDLPNQLETQQGLKPTMAGYVWRMRVDGWCVRLTCLINLQDCFLLTSNLSVNVFWASGRIQQRTWVVSNFYVIAVRFVHHLRRYLMLFGVNFFSNLWHQKNGNLGTGSMTGQHPQHGVLLKPAFPASVGSSASPQMSWVPRYINLRYRYHIYPRSLLLKWMHWCSSLTQLIYYIYI